MKNLRVLFIGNSHTFVHDVPLLFRNNARNDGLACDVTMISHGGWFLAQHVKEPDVKFNILHGEYDYVVLQEHAHPFGPVEKMEEAVLQLDAWAKEAGSKTVIYETWAKKVEPEIQDFMTKAHHDIASKINALLAPVGEKWWEHIQNHPEVEMYYQDGEHSSVTGATLAAKVIYDTIIEDYQK